MNTSDTQNPDNTNVRPLGYWLTAVDRLLAAEFGSAFEGEGATRRDWRLLNAVDGTATPSRPLREHKLHHLIERGWVTADPEGWTLTDDGRAAKDRLGLAVDGIRARVSDAVDPDDLATTLASLEKIARALGWDEETPLPRRHGRRFGDRSHRGHGFGPHGFRPDFGRGHGRPGFGRHGFGPDLRDDRGCAHTAHHGDAEHDGRPEHGHGEHRGHGHRDHGHAGRVPARHAQHAYERGFDAGFTRGRDAQ